MDSPTLDSWSHDFQSLPVDADLSTVPGVGCAAVAKLKAHNINTTHQLIGHYWLCDCDVPTFMERLEDCGILPHCAQRVAVNIDQKMRTVLS